MARTLYLVDANLLIALAVAEHEHHDRAVDWLGTKRFATTPTVQGALVRFVVRTASTSHAAALVDSLNAHPRHELWADDLPYDARTLRDVIGHRQVTDAYLAAVAEHHGARVATFDAGLSRLRPALVELLA